MTPSRDHTLEPPIALLKAMSTHRILDTLSSTFDRLARRMRPGLWMVVALLIGLVHEQVAAQLVRPFTPRYSNPSVNGDVMLIGNINSHCIDSPTRPENWNQVCRNARAGDPSVRNDRWSTEDVNALSGELAGERNSSSARLTLPPGAQVLFAGLYWGAQALTLEDPGVRQVRFAPPGQGYRDIGAQALDNFWHASDDFEVPHFHFHAFADVTELVRQGGSGDYSVADIAVVNTQLANPPRQVSIGSGWALVVAYYDPAAPKRSVTVFDGWAVVGVVEPDVIVQVNGILTPTVGPVTSRVGIVAFDGDAPEADAADGVSPSLEFGADVNNLHPISNALNPEANVFNSTISSLGVAMTDRVPGYLNTLGLDIDLFEPNTPLPNGAESAVFRLRGHPSDNINLGVVTIVTDVDSSLAVVKSQADVNGGELVPGDEVEYTLQVVNTGTISAGDAVITDDIPANTTFVPGSLRVTVDGLPQARSDSASDDDAEFDAAGNRVVFRLGRGATGHSGGEIRVGESVTASFRVRVNPGVAAGTQVTNAAVLSFELGSVPGSHNQPSNPVTAVVGEPPRIVAVDDEGEIDGTNGGTAVENVLENDLGPSGGPPSLSDVELTEVSSSDPGVRLDPSTGSVVVDPNVPGGTYHVVYRVCERARPDACANAVVTVTVEGNLTVRLAKSTLSRQVRIGDLVRYTLTLENTGNADIGNVSVVDTPPTGFSYVEGSLQVFDQDGAGGVAQTHPLRIVGIDIAANSRATVVYLMRVGAAAGRGEHTNSAQAYNGGTQVPVSNVARATVSLGADPDFEQALVLGTVFHDANGNGVQDGDDEPGIPGVRVATLEGVAVQTDALGRFHLAGVDVGNVMRGRNFMVKVDPATLPQGATFTTRNPLTRRITQGLPARFDFGVEAPGHAIEGVRQDFEMRIGEVFFAAGSAEIGTRNEAALDAMAAKVREHGGGEVIITADGESEALATDRALAVRRALESRLDPQQRQGLSVSVRTSLNDPETTVVRFKEWTELGVILFDTAKADVKARYAPVIEKVAAALERRGGGVVVITGHADRRSSDEYNIALGMRRARAVYDAIAQRLSPELRARIRVDANSDPQAPESGPPPGMASK